MRSNIWIYLFFSVISQLPLSQGDTDPCICHSIAQSVILTRQSSTQKMAKYVCLFFCHHCILNSNDECEATRMKLGKSLFVMWCITTGSRNQQQKFYNVTKWENATFLSGTIVMITQDKTWKWRLFCCWILSYHTETNLFCALT